MDNGTSNKGTMNNGQCQWTMEQGTREQWTIVRTMEQGIRNNGNGTIRQRKATWRGGAGNMVCYTTLMTQNTMSNATWPQRTTWSNASNSMKKWTGTKPNSVPCLNGNPVARMLPMGATPHVSAATSPFRRQAAGHQHLLPASSVLTAHTHSSATPVRRQVLGFWAKWNSKVLLSPDGWEICIRFNIGGGRYCSLNREKHGDSWICLFFLWQQIAPCPLWHLGNVTGWGHGSSRVRVQVGNSNPQKTRTRDTGLMAIVGVAGWCDRVTPLLTILTQRNMPSKTQPQQDKNTEESRTTRNMKGRCRHNKRAGVQGAPQIVIFIWYTTDDYTGPQHEVRRHTPPRHIVSISMQREGVRPSPSCRANLTRRGGHGPSLSCLCPKDAARVYHSHFNATRWGMPLLVVSSFQSRHGKEGLPPPRRVISISTCRGG